MFKFKNFTTVFSVLFITFISSKSYSDNHNIYEVLDLIRKDIKTLSERLELLINDKELRSRMAEQSLKEYKKGFTLDKTFENTFALYEETIESKRNHF